MSNTIIKLWGTL